MCIAESIIGQSQKVGHGGGGGMKGKGRALNSGLATRLETPHWNNEYTART
jgi:hypothetical protein